MRVITQYGKVKSQPSTRDNAVTLRKNSTGSPITRRKLNLIEGSGVTLTLADDIAGDEADITVASTATATDRMRYRGVWDSATAYEANDVVSYRDAGPGIIDNPILLRNMYVALSSNTNVKPLNFPATWAAIGYVPSFLGSPPGIVVLSSTGGFTCQTSSTGDITTTVDSAGLLNYSLPTTGVVAGSYSPMAGTVDAKGRLTTASSLTQADLYSGLGILRSSTSSLATNNSNTTWATGATITGLNSSALYYLSGSILFQTVATTTGIAFSFIGTTSTSYSYGVFNHMTAATTMGGGRWDETLATYTASTGVIAANTPYVASFSGLFNGTGNLQVRFRSEVNTSMVTFSTIHMVAIPVG